MTCPDTLPQGLSWVPQETQSPLPCGWPSQAISPRPDPWHQEGRAVRGTGVGEAPTGTAGPSW